MLTVLIVLGRHRMSDQINLERSKYTASRIDCPSYRFQAQEISNLPAQFNFSGKAYSSELLPPGSKFREEECPGIIIKLDISILTFNKNLKNSQRTSGGC